MIDESKIKNVSMQTEYFNDDDITLKITKIEPDFDDGGFLENNFIVLTKYTLDEFLKQEHPTDLIGLYSFYYYTAKWQKTNIIKCTTNYVATGLKWHEDKVRKNKKILQSLGLIKDFIRKDENGKIKGYYIRMNYIIKKQTINQSGIFPETGFFQRQENKETNALSVNNINALSVNNKYIDLLNYWNNKEIIIHKQDIFLNSLKKKTKNIIEIYGIEQIKKAIDNYYIVLSNSNKYYWSHKWNLIDFINRGIEKFIDSAYPLSNYLKLNFKNSNKEQNIENTKKSIQSEIIKDTRGVPLF